MLANFPPFDYKNPQILEGKLRENLPFLHGLVFQIITSTVQTATQVEAQTEALAKGQTVAQTEAGTQVEGQVERSNTQVSPPYLVGGIVRDLFLGRPNLDLDFVCLSEAKRWARVLGAAFKALRQVSSVKLTEHSKFGTVRLDLIFEQAGAQEQAELHVDLATARIESYAQPGQLPDVVFPATLTQDLQRRDFTINTLALLPVAGGGLELVDVFGGLADLKAGLLRILHPASFADDPTRLLRGIRFAARFGYTFEPHTAALFQQAVARHYLHTLSSDRIRHELILLLKEARPEIALHLLQKEGLLAEIAPALIWQEQEKVAEEQLKVFSGVRRLLGANEVGWLDYLALWLHQQEPKLITTLLRQLRFSEAEIKVVLHLAQLWQTERPTLLTQALSNSQLYNLLNPYDPAALKLFEVLLQLEADLAASQQLQLYLTELVQRQPQLNGDYLRQAGLKPGPHFKAILNQLHAALLDGQIHTRSDEAAFLNQKIQEYNNQDVG
jgi:tRNA nucleotidyltransferase (CCA-adding enzyme)